LRRFLIAGNWKMNLVHNEAKALIDGIVQGASSCTTAVDILICPPFPFLEGAVQMTQGTGIQVGAQNVHHEQSGAYTGEVSAPMLKSIQCTHVIIGHSERRAYFHEGNDLINAKVKTSLAWGLTPVLCIGESLEQRRAGATFSVLNEQLVYGLQGIDNDHVGRIVIAYEPVWAIGTGMSATSLQAEEAHRFIRGVIGTFSDNAVALNMRIIYGGSVNPDNAAQLLCQEDVDGALIGGASLKAESFCEIVGIAESIREKAACR